MEGEENKTKLNRYVPEHPLPEEIRKMEKDDTVCQFCGVSYLIHSEMKALEERVEEAEKQMEYYRGSVEREEKLKVTLRLMEEEKEKLYAALEASKETSKILTTDIMTKTEQVERLKSECKQSDEKWLKCEGEKKELEGKFQKLSALWSEGQTQLTSQRVELDKIKETVTDENNNLAGMCKLISGKISKVSDHFTARIKDLECTLTKTQAERDAEGAKCRQLEEQIKKQQEVTRDLQGSHLEAERLQTRCAELDGRTKGLQDEINEHLSVNQEQRKEISHLGETVRTKEKEIQDCREQNQRLMESSKEQLADLQSAKETQEKESCQLKEKCKSLEFKLAESLKDQSENRERESSSHEQMAILRESLARANEKQQALEKEREKMITAHHNRIEQLRESFKKKREEADGWPAKLEQVIKEKDEAFAKEKQQLWLELSESFQKEMDEQRKQHAEELGRWRSEAENAQGKFKQDIAFLNRKHREEVKRLEKAAAEEKDRLTQARQSNAALVENLESKMADLEWRLQQPIIESAQEASSLQARLRESRDELHETEAYCKELEAKVKRYKEEVFFLQETVRRECEERLELTESLTTARTQLLTLQRANHGASRNGLSQSRTSSSPIGGSVGRTVSLNEPVSASGSQATTCAVGFDGGVSRKARDDPRDSGRASRAGSVDDGRQRIAVALGRTGSKSRLAGDMTS